MVGAMEFGDVVRRRMVRNYTSEPVDRAVLERVAPSMLRIPSAGFTQVSVVVVTNAERRAAIADLAGEEHYVSAGFRALDFEGTSAHSRLCQRGRLPAPIRRARQGLGSRDGAGLDRALWCVDAGAA